MKKLLILLALAGLGATACGGDDSGDKDTGSKDASVAKDAAAARPQQIDTASLGKACTTATAKTDCTGVGAVRPPAVCCSIA